LSELWSSSLELQTQGADAEVAGATEVAGAMAAEGAVTASIIPAVGVVAAAITEAVATATVEPWRGVFCLVP